MNKKNRQNLNGGQAALAVDEWVNDTLSAAVAPVHDTGEDDALFDSGNVPVSSTETEPFLSASAPLRRRPGLSAEKSGPQQKKTKPMFLPTSPAAVTVQAHPPKPNSSISVTPSDKQRIVAPPANTTAIQCEDDFEEGFPANVSEMGTKELLAYLTSQQPNSGDMGRSGVESVAVSTPSVEGEKEVPADMGPPTSIAHVPTATKRESSVEPEGETSAPSHAYLFPEVPAAEGNTSGKTTPPASRAGSKQHAVLIAEAETAIDVAAGQALFENLEYQITGASSTRASLTPEDYYRAITSMPIFRRKKQVYSDKGADAAEATMRTFADGYRTALPDGAMEDCGANAVICHVVDSFIKCDNSLSPAKRMQLLLEEPGNIHRIVQAGKALAAQIIKTEPGPFVAAGRYIFGGNYMDLFSGNPEDKEAFGRAYGRVIGEHLAENVAEARSDEGKADQCVTMLQYDGMLVDYFPVKGVPGDIQSATIPMIKGMSALHHPKMPDAGLVENECVIIPDGMAVSDASALSFLLAPDGGLFFSAGDKEYGGSLPYSYFRAAMGPCRVVIKSDAPLPQKEFRASFLRTQPTIRMASSEREGEDAPVLFFLPPDGAEISKDFLADLFGSTAPLHINLTKDELDAELVAHGRDMVENQPAGINISIEANASDITVADMLEIVDRALGDEVPMFESSDIVAGIPLDYVETIAAQPDSGEEFVFYRAPER